MKILYTSNISRFLAFSLLTISLFFTSGLFSQSIDISCLGTISMPPPAPPPYKGSAQPPITSRSGSQYKIPFDTIRYNATIGTQAYDIVFVEDGVTNDADIAGADNYIDSVIQQWQDQAQYKNRFKYFNIYRVARYSKQRGAAYGFYGDTAVDNRYGSRYGAYGLPRLILPEKYDTLFADADEFVPQHDLVINLVYDPSYGGSGWDLYDGRKVASFGIDSASGWHLGDEVITHEMQHTMPFGGRSYLGDEYVDEYACSIYDTLPIKYLDSPNFTGDTVNNRKWQYCMGIPGVGFFDSAGICPGNFRPTYLCAMRSVFNIPPSDLFNYGMPAFCPVCRENSTAFFDSMINPVYNISPSPGAFSGNYTYSVLVDTPDVNTYRNQWFLDDSLIATGPLSLTVNFSTVSQSQNHILKFVCTDIDPFIIDTGLRRPWITQWNLLTTTQGISAIDEKQVSIFPNPVSGLLNLSFTNSGSAMDITIYAPDGRVVDAYRTGQNMFSIDVSSLPVGLYFLTLQDKDQALQKRFIKQ